MKTKITMRRTNYLNKLLFMRYFLLVVTLFATIYLSAQESCYEQYFREHNKKILTAEDADDSTYIAYVYVALVDSTWYMWLSVDPLADKNISSSPYMYCNGNPIMLIDPDGRDDYEFDADGNVNVLKNLNADNIEYDYVS